MIALPLHIVSAFISLILGGWVLYSRKGTKIHKLIGRVWVTAMLVVCISSFWLTDINHGSFSPIHILSVWTLFCLGMAIVSIRKKHVMRHRRYMQGSYIGLVIAGLVAAAVPGRIMNNWIVSLF